MRGAGGTTVSMLGICERVLIHVGGIELTIHLYCVKDSNFPVLLGVPFLHAVGARMAYHKDGSVEMEMEREGKTASLELSSPGEHEYLFNIPGRSESTVLANKVINRDEKEGQEKEREI